MLDILETDLEKADLNTEDIDVERYGISRRHYFYMKKIAKGGEGIDLSEEKLSILSEKLGVKIRMVYHVK